jgi:hypothetical protein
LESCGREHALSPFSLRRGNNEYVFGDITKSRRCAIVTNPSRIDYKDMKNKRIDHRRAPRAATSVASSRSETLDLVMSSSTVVVLKTLAEHIAARLEDRAFCVVFENDLERFWPRKEMARTKREREIQGFAESQGWAAAILEGGFGTRAIFRRLDGSH